MTSQLSRSVQPLWSGGRVCLASTSKQGFSTSSICASKDTPPTSSTSSMQQTQTQITRGGDRRSASGASPGGRVPRAAPSLPPYNEWIHGEGRNYEQPPPGRGPFWIGSTPFPLNPSFNPPPPISQKQKKMIWQSHVADKGNTVRVLSGNFGIPMERIHAILRLQALEVEWIKKGKALQEPFRKNMERLLGAIETKSGENEEEETATVGKTSKPRAPTYEEFPMNAKSENAPSVILPALEKELQRRKDRRRTLPTGGPAAKGPLPDVKIIKGPAGRASMTIVDMSARPTSYRGGGVIARNQRRAQRRQESKERLRIKAEKVEERRQERS